MKRLLYILFLFIVLFGCTKSMSKRWVVLDLLVVDGLSGEPIQTGVSLGYWEGGGFSQAYEGTESLGHTGEDGRLKVKHRIPRNYSGLKAKIHVPGYYGLVGWPVTRDVSIAARGKNVLIVELDPRYPYLLTLKNINCTGASDSIWITLPNAGPPLIYTGCIDSTLTGMYGLTNMVSEPLVTFDITTKKSGVVNTYSESFSLLPAELTSIQIDY